MGARRPAHLFRDARTRSTTTRRLRREKKFTVNIRNPETPVASLWALDLAARKHQAPHRGRRLLRRRLHDLERQQVGRLPRPVAESLQARHHRRRISTPISICSKPRPASIERLTNNAEIGESGLSFSPDSTAGRVLGTGRSRELRHEQQPRLPPRGRGDAASHSASWARRSTATSRSASGRRTAATIYFNEGIKATNQIVSLDIDVTTRCGRSPKRKPASRSTRIRTPACC